MCSQTMKSDHRGAPFLRRAEPLRDGTGFGSRVSGAVCRAWSTVIPILPAQVGRSKLPRLIEPPQGLVARGRVSACSFEVQVRFADTTGLAA